MSVQESVMLKTVMDVLMVKPNGVKHVLHDFSFKQMENVLLVVTNASNAKTVRTVSSVNHF